MESLAVTKTEEKNGVTVKTYKVPIEVDDDSELIAQLDSLGGGMLEPGELSGLLLGAEEFHAAFDPSGKLVAVHIRGKEDEGTGEEYTIAKGNTSVITASGGRKKRSRLNVQTRRSKRNGRTRKGRKLRKFTARRR